MNAEETGAKKETNYLELPEEVKRDLLNSPNEVVNIEDDLKGKEIENDVRNSKSSVSSSHSRLADLGITTLGQNPNNTSDCRLATKLAVNRENVKKELTHGIEHVAQKKNLVETFSTIQGKQSCKEENKPSSTSCSTDEIGIGINESRTVRFRNNLFVAIEELRIQRTLDLENEERIKTLMTEKHELERKKEEETSKFNSVVEQHAQQEIDIKKQQEDRLLQYEEDKAKLTLAAECTEKELKVLKDEVRALHLVKYNLEKKVKEQDRLIQLQNSARDSHESQISALEQRSKKALDQCAQLADFVEKTDTRISAASRLQRKLMYTNEHQKCLLESYKRELESKKFELVALKAAVAQKNDASVRSTEEERSRADALYRELQLQNEVCRKSQNQLEDARIENEKLIQSLKEAHELLDRHVQSINKHCELEAVAHLELDETKTECQTLKDSLGKVQEETQRLEDTLRSKTNEWGDQKHVLESRLEDLQKEYESLSEAHNSLEQLNSNWSEQNMEQKTKMESMVKEVDELKKRLVHAEESIRSHKETNEELSNTYSNEISSLKEKLQRAKHEYESEAERTDSLENQITLMRKNIEDLQQEIENKEKEQVSNKKEVTETSSQTDNGFYEQISSLSDKLLQATQSCNNQTERADYLEDQCTMLKEKVNDLLLTVARKEKEKIKNTDTIDNASQTDDAPEVNSDGPQSENHCTFTENNQVQDHSISETQAKSNFKNQSQKENTCKDNDVRLNRVTRVTKTDMTENTKENNHDKLLLGIEKSIRQFKVDADNKVVKENADNYVAPGDDEKSSSSYYENGKICQEALTKSSGTSTDTEATKPVLSMDVTHNASPPQVIYGSIDFEESINTAQCNRGINEGIAKDSTDLPKTDEFSVDLESALADGKSERQGDGDVYEPGEKSQKLAISGDRRRKKKDNPTEMSTTATKNTSCKEKAAGKKVTFNLGEDKSPDTEQQNSTEEINKEEPRMMFSDEEDGENKCRSIDEDVNQRISRIQNLLRSDRLRTNRKRKFPVV